MRSSLNKAQEWLDPFFDQKSRIIVQNWIDQDAPELEEAFYKDLEFGTGGMRGIMGVGTNRINKYTIGKATLGLANYLIEYFPNQELSVAIAFDSRNNSLLFAQFAANVLSSKGIKAYLFEDLRPTPLLSFAVRYLKCNAGIVITASHNPKEYNGYKVYWNDGAQLVSPNDKGVLSSVNEIKSFKEIDFKGDENLIKIIDPSVEAAYFEKVKALIFDSQKTDKSIPIVFTSIHGTGETMIPKLMDQLGFANFRSVKEQSEPNGDFPTVKSPNPEERSALEMAIDLAKEQNAELVLGTDPDTDRVGLAIKNNEGEWILLNGNQAGSILINYLLEKLNSSEYEHSFICKTIVTTQLIEEIAHSYDVKCINTLTGFKYIAQVIREQEGKMNFIGGGEESFGYLAGDFVRDKDAVMAVAIFSQIAGICKANGSNLYEYLLSIYKKHGVYKERLLSVSKKGKAGLEAITQLMENYRSNTPKELAGEKVISFSDYLSGFTKNTINGNEEKIGLEKSNVLQFLTEKGSLITVRPSGTEPKIKYYFSVKEDGNNSIENLLIEAELHLDRLEKEFI